VIALRIFVLAAFSATLLAPQAAAEPPVPKPGHAKSLKAKPPQANSPKATSSAAKPAEAMAVRINAVRARHGLPPLRVAPKLMRSSRAYAKRLARNGSLYHGSAYRVPGFRQSAEMLASDLGWRARLRGPIQMWLHSPGHRALMLSGAFRYVGAFPARRHGASGPEVVWVVHFGAH
jgi:uncharacterized protein YkwD